MNNTDKPPDSQVAVMGSDSRINSRTLAGEKRRRTGKSQRTRYRLACARCQRRKIKDAELENFLKCDDQVPECSNCRTAGEACIDGESSRLGTLRDLTDTNDRDRDFSKLQSRVRCLETLVTTRLPDVDLNKLHQVPHGHDHADCSTIAATTNPTSTSTSDGHVDTSPTLVMDEASVSSEPIATASSGPLREPSRGPPVDEVGLMSLNGAQDPRYIGPSSGHFLLRMLMTTANTQRRMANFHTTASMLPQDPPTLPTGLVEAFHGPLPLPSIDHATKMTTAFFGLVHPLYPILNELATLRKLETLRQGYETDPYSIFQVFMVLAIGATLLSHRYRVRLPSESYCLSALQYYHQLNVGDSVQGLQCLLLLQIYTMHCPHMKLNSWYLNYQCLAVTVDLGLQKNLGTNSGISLVEQELRTRLFWVVLTLDRKIAIMMGRPIGLRDEACDLRMPRALDDSDTTAPSGLPNSSSISFSAHMFYLTRLKTEYKYVANSIVRDPPSFAYPAITNFADWQRDLVERVDRWISEIPQTSHKEQYYLGLVAQVHGLDLKIAVLRPSFAIPAWTPESAGKCQEAAQMVLKLFDQLYRENLLVYSWDSMHSITLAMITLLCGARAAPALCIPDDVSLGLELGLRLLSTCGEHWSGAKRCRDIIEELGRPLVSGLRDISTTNGAISTTGQHDTASADPNDTTVGMNGISLLNFTLPMSDGSMGGTAQTGSGLLDNWFTQDIPEDPGFGGDPGNVDIMLRHWFDGFVSTYMST